MTSAELRDILARLGLPQVRAAALLGVDPRTIRYWANGEREIPELVSRVLRLASCGKFDLNLLTNHRATD